jgi:hypothetical protein
MWAVYSEWSEAFRPACQVLFTQQCCALCLSYRLALGLVLLDGKLLIPLVLPQVEPPDGV